MVLSLVAFVVSLLTFLVALLLFDGISWPVVFSVFCGWAAATVLNVTHVIARRSRRDQRVAGARIGGRYNQRENSREP